MMDAIIVISKKAYRIIGSEILLAIDGNPLMIPLYIIKNTNPVLIANII